MRDQGNEPIHIHVQKGDSECKYWLDIDLYEITECHQTRISRNEIYASICTSLGRQTQQAIAQFWRLIHP
jgi:hypothetical protein